VWGQLKRINVNVDEELHLAVRMKCLQSGTTVQEFVERNLRAWVGVPAKPKQSIEVKKEAQPEPSPQPVKVESKPSTKVDKKHLGPYADLAAQMESMPDSEEPKTSYVKKGFNI